MHTFYEGQRVICVDDTIKPEFIVEAAIHFPNWITKGKPYRVREVMENDGIAVGLLLEGVNNPPVFIPLLGRVQEGAFASWRFAPAVEQTDDVEVYNEETVAA